MSKSEPIRELCRRVVAIIDTAPLDQLDEAMAHYQECVAKLYARGYGETYEEEYVRDMMSTDSGRELLLKYYPAPKLTTILNRLS